MFIFWDKILCSPRLSSSAARDDLKFIIHFIYSPSTELIAWAPHPQLYFNVVLLTTPNINADLNSEIARSSEEERWPAEG